MKLQHNFSSSSPSQLLSFTSKGLEGHLGFGEILIPVILHVQVHLASSRALPQLQGNLPAAWQTSPTTMCIITHVNIFKWEHCKRSLSSWTLRRRCRLFLTPFGSPRGSWHFQDRCSFWVHRYPDWNPSSTASAPHVPDTHTQIRI